MGVTVTVRAVSQGYYSVLGSSSRCEPSHQRSLDIYESWVCSNELNHHILLSMLDVSLNLHTKWNNAWRVWDLFHIIIMLSESQAECRGWKFKHMIIKKSFTAWSCEKKKSIFHTKHAFLTTTNEENRKMVMKMFLVLVLNLMKLKKQFPVLVCSQLCCTFATQATHSSRL